MDFLQAIDNAEAALADTLAELHATRELLGILEQDAKNMKLEIAGMKSFANRQGLTDSVERDENTADVVPISADVDLTSSSGPDIALMSRNDAVIAVMHAAGGPMDRAAVHGHFFDGGRFDSIDDISLSLSGLKRTGRVEKLGRGLWGLPEDSVAVR